VEAEALSRSQMHTLYKKSCQQRDSVMQPYHFNDSFCEVIARRFGGHEGLISPFWGFRPQKWETWNKRLAVSTNDVDVMARVKLMPDSRISVLMAEVLPRWSCSGLWRNHDIVVDTVIIFQSQPCESRSLLQEPSSLI